MSKLNDDVHRAGCTVKGDASHQERWSHFFNNVKEWGARLFALSAAIDYEVLEARDSNGEYRFRRGRHKYYGLGSLIVFFAVFSAYGMGHMLAGMAQMSTVGAVLAGLIWGLFQWSLERQILISIRNDDTLWRKVFGLSWRAGLAVMSASVMVYPFFVESNRAEIDVKIGEISQQRMLRAQRDTEQIANLPRLRQELEQQQQSVGQLELALKNDPPDIGGYRLKSKQCWSRFQIENEKLSLQLRSLQNQREKVNGDVAASLDSRILAVQQKRDAARSNCNAADVAMFRRISEWQQLKQHEHATAIQQVQLAQQQVQQANLQQQGLVSALDRKISLASQSGFAADFFAVASLLAEDKYRRFQLLWWLSWFVAIELVAVLLKFGTQTELDEDLAFRDKKFIANAEQEHQLWQERQTTAYLRDFTQQQAEQAVWRNQTPEDGAELLSLELSLAREQAKLLIRSKTELALARTLLEAGIHELKLMNELQSAAQQVSSMKSKTTLLDQMCERAQQELHTRYNKAFSG